MSLNFVTFASSNWTESPKRYKEQLQTIESKFHLFEKTFVLNEHDLGDAYKDRFSKYFSDHGFAYFSWKAVAILKALEQIKDGDLLFYMDGGCTFPMDRINDFIKEFQYATDLFSVSDALFGLTFFPEKPFPELPGFPNVMIVKKEILKCFGLDSNKEFLFFYPHWQAGLVLCRKNQETIDFLNEWYHFFLDNYESCIRGGYRDKTGQHPLFIQNGSDQAVLQCMLFTKKTKIFPLNFIHRYKVIEHIKK